MGYQGGHARSLWPRDNTTSEELTLKTFTAILGGFWACVAINLAHKTYVHIKQTLTRMRTDQQIQKEVVNSSSAKRSRNRYSTG